MQDRDFTELDLRHMLERARDLRSDIVKGRWIIETHHGRREWEVVVEPDREDRVLIVVTAYPLGEVESS